MNEYIDEDIIPLKVGLYKNKKQSLDEGYYISGNFETFSKKYFFKINDLKNTIHITINNKSYIFFIKCLPSFHH